MNLQELRGNHMAKPKDYTALVHERADFKTDLFLDEWINKLHKENLDKTIKQFEDEWLEAMDTIIETAAKLRAKFVLDYPVEKIMGMSLDEYMIAPIGSGYEETFCSRLKMELKDHASMGNIWPNTFGVYLKGGTEIALHKSLENQFGDDYSAAFKFIKTQIIHLLHSGAIDDYVAVVENKLNSSFKYKLLTVYYPEKYIPVCTRESLDEYCKCIGLEIDDSLEMIYKNIALTKVKKSYENFQNWNNAKFMFFCVWLVEKHKQIDLKISDEVIAADIDKEAEKLTCEGKEKLAYVKARVNQGIFRDKLLKRYNECCMCKVSNPQLLVASHIKPWVACEPKEKLDVDNGFLLCPNHDALFDKGYVTFDDYGYVIVSEMLSSMDKQCMNLEDANLLCLTDGNRKYLKYHRENIFKKK